MREPLDELICRHLVFDEGGRAIGFTPHLRIAVFIDLLSAALIPSHAAILVEAIRPALPTYTPGTWGIVAPKWGNPVLGYELGRALDVPLLLARDDNLFGRWFDGVVDASLTWVLVDDVASDGERLAEVVDRARGDGLRVSEARFVASRSEGDAMSVLEAEGISAVALRDLDDESLRKLHAEWRRR